MNDLQNWIRIRKDLYRQMEAEVNFRLGGEKGEDPELKRYRKDYEREFTKKWRPADQNQLFQRLNESRLVLMGDFHALPQSQKTHLRVLKNFQNHFEGAKPAVLCLECFEVQNQPHLDQFMAGKISEKDLIHLTGWNEKWGFPFDNVRPLLRWAQTQKIPVYGLNKAVKKRSAASLKARDVFAAIKLQDILSKHPEAVVFAVYGDLHLAKNHIPEEILKRSPPGFKTKMFRLFQNAEKIYFQLLEQELESSVDVVELSSQSYCLLNVPPWVKWQNYLMYLEQTYDVGLEDDDDDEESVALDFTDHVGAYIKIISEELGHPLRADDLSVYTAEDENFWTQLQNHFSEKELAGIEALIEEESSFFLPTLGIGYLARPTVNHAATLAAKYVHAKLSGLSKSCLVMPQDFLRQTWQEGIAYFGSKIINHKRKTDTVADLRMALTARGSSQIAKEPLMLALSQKMSELMAMSHRKPTRRPVRPQKKASYLIAARLLGGMMGERLYSAYQKKKISIVTLEQILKASVLAENFEASYYEMMEIIESLPAPFRSKKEKM